MENIENKSKKIVNFPKDDGLKILKGVFISRNELQKSGNAEVVGIADLQEKREKEKRKEFYKKFAELQNLVSNLMSSKDYLQKSKDGKTSKMIDCGYPITKKETEIENLTKEEIIKKVINYDENTVNNNLFYYSILINKIIAEEIFPLNL